MTEKNSVYGLVAEFDEKEEILAAAHCAYAEGYRRMDAYTPFPMEELWHALGRRETTVPLITLLGGMIWGLGGYFMQWYSLAVDYPLDVGGRPFHSWPQFIPITFEMTVLGASLSALLAMLVLNKLPQPYHPIFNARNFERASQDKFFLCIESLDPKFDLVETKRFLRTLKPHKVSEVRE